MGRTAGQRRQNTGLVINMQLARKFTVERRSGTDVHKNMRKGIFYENGGLRENLVNP